MSVRNDHELPRSQADVSNDAHLGTDQGPFEGQEALERLWLLFRCWPSMSRRSPMTRRRPGWLRWKRHYLQTALGLGYSEEPARSWVAALMAHLREQLELMSEPGSDDGRPSVYGHFLLPRLRRAISIPSNIMSWI